MQGTAHSLFGSIAQIDVLTGTFAILIIIVFVQYVEYILSTLIKLTNDTPFEGMVIAIIVTVLKIKYSNNLPIYLYRY